MDKFIRLTATACPLSLPNLNTDQILPARYLKWPRSKGLGTVLFDDVRLDAKGQPRETFAFNEHAYRGAKILLAGAISAAAPRARRRSTRSTITASAASLRRPSAISFRRTP